MTTRLARVVAVGALALLVAGCGTVEEPAEAPPTDVVSASPTPSETPSASPTPTAITREEAGARYLELVAPVNAGIEAWNAAAAASDYATMRAMAGERAASYRSFADGLIAAEWPPEAEAAVDRLVSELAGDVGVFVQVGTSTTDAETQQALALAAPPGSAAQELRMLLGLDNIPAG
ncbi:hypothetical protein [Cellulomonas cellasea]|uniref:Lipoprotein n=1 Tax=Cellulomonas cellasea TaxID=43670 RepID=A0A7W4Y976_9CELL|nr:hypothetical protein [Cellulomonas cellasea]MBB2921278.1 hypothetical protein [Cellulomonas cellasea]